MDTLRALERYIEAIAGAAPVLRDIDGAGSARLPVYLRAAYHVMSVRLFNRSFLLALRAQGKASSTPEEYAKQIGLMQSILGQDVALVLDQIAAYVRNRLVQRGVPFIVPGRQMFLPFIGADLRERFARQRLNNTDALSAPAQVVLLFQLLKPSVEQLSLRRLAAELKYSAMTLSNVAEELRGLHLCDVVTNGRTRHLRFGRSRRELWHQALPVLRDPVRSRHWARFSHERPKCLAAGVTALAQYTLIDDDAVPTVAIHEAEYRKHVKEGGIVICPAPDDAEVQIESWNYAAGILADGPNVDRLSLYLSLRATQDDRMRKALKELLEEMNW